MAEFTPKSPLNKATTAGVQAAAVGTLVSALQNALGNHSYGAAGVLTRTGGTIGFFAAVGATFAYTSAAVSNQRQTDDAVNTAAGACAAAFLAGMRARSFPVAIGGCAFMGAVMGTYDYAGKLASTEGGAIDPEKRRKFFKNPDLVVDLPSK
ncbi:uncharacterized protein ARMOST_08811 [Armillaria ostoyae]|uniref:Uncharacterized protein n=1 Tax=Armillaria ostoyae TaxID=47428 RepID=A0A284R9Q4_ARMOS|nr:uncharacterized protein ARMOST_08811 [Armillaria ostoyae]